MHTFMVCISTGVASESLYVTGCHPCRSRSLEDDRSHEVCVSVLRVISPSSPFSCIMKHQKGVSAGWLNSPWKNGRFARSSSSVLNWIDASKKRVSKWLIHVKGPCLRKNKKESPRKDSSFCYTFVKIRKVYKTLKTQGVGREIGIGI